MNATPVFHEQLLGAIPRLRRYSRSLAFDVSTVDDLVQTTLERALAHSHQFDQSRDMLAWTLSIAHNAHMDECRRHARMPLAESGDAMPEVYEQLAAISPDIGLRLDLIAALNQLPVKLREPLLLVALEQLSYADCAERLQIPIGTVMSRISRARVTLQSLLDSGSTSGDEPARRN